MAVYSILQTPKLYTLISKMWHYLPEEFKYKRWGGGENNIFVSSKGKETVEEVILTASKMLKSNISEK